MQATVSIDDFLQKLQCVRKTAGGWVARCPAHDDKNPSLSVWLDKEGNIALKCHAGCKFDDICRAAGVAPRDLFSHPATAGAPGRAQGAAQTQSRIVANYDYYAKDGKPIVRVVRKEPKAFLRMSPDGKGGWKWGGTGSAVALYRWPELAAAVGRGETVFLVEGEKDADNLRRAGAVATTCLGGASKWQGELAREFRGAAQVFIIADRDTEANGLAGQRFALKEKAAIAAQDVKVRAVCLPAEIDGRAVKDVSDALAAGWDWQKVAGHCAVAREVESEFPQLANGGAGGDSLKSEIDAAIGAATRRDERLSADERRRIIDDTALDWMQRHGIFYRDLDNPCAAGVRYFYAATKEVFEVAADDFQSWLAVESGIDRIKNEFKSLIAACVDAGLRREYSRAVRFARFWESRDGNIYISNGAGEMARITAQGVEIVDNGTDNVLFSPKHICEPWTLLDAARGVSPLEMRVFGGISTPGNPLAPLLLLLWILAMPRNLKNKPPLSLCGDVGSGKTRTARAIFEMFGMTERINKANKTEKGEEEFTVSVGYGGFTVLDNVDSGVKWLADSASHASTGGTQEKRKLYSDDELFFVKARSAVIFTSANPLYATDAGLADRLINIVFERPEGRASSDDEISMEIAENRDAMMTWICNTLAGALRVDESPPEGLNKRHPDWAKWCWKCGVAMGRREDAEMAMTRAEADKAVISVKSDTMVGSVLYRIMGELGYAWEGTARELRNLMTRGGGEFGNNGVGEARENCGHNAETLVVVPDKAVKPEEYDDFTKEHKLTAKRLGDYIRGSKVALKEVFKLSQRVSNGRVLWRFEPPQKDS